MSQRWSWLVLAFGLSVAGAAFGGDTHAPAAASAGTFEDVPGAHALEGHIRAPCCWNQTLDIHGSEVSNELRREIRTRLKAGESSEAIKQDFVDRYGERILAVPPSNPLADVATVVSLGFLAAGVGAVFMLLRWKRRGEKEAKAAKKAKRTDKRDELDDQIDAELDEL
jgi:cytochrome c-type biogenesis protein CcmH